MIDFGDETESFVASVVQLGQLLLTEETLEATLERVTKLACRGIGECEFASVSYLDGAKPFTLVATDPIAEQLDRIQYADDSGPCLEALRERRVVSVPSIASGTGSQRFRSTAKACGVQSSLAVPMVAGDAAVGALNLYARDSDAFSEIAHDSALLLAAQAAVAVMNTRTYHHTRELVANLETALVTRDLIGQAKGIVMVNEKVTAEEAFALLRDASQLRNMKLRDVAAEVADTGLTPAATA
jgi:GAF domain-containing protein